MAPKKKTVRDLTSDMEIFEVKFKAMEKVFEKIKAIETVDKDKIIVTVDNSESEQKLESKLKELQRKLDAALARIEYLENAENRNAKEQNLLCNKCDLTFDGKKSLKMHNMKKHAKPIKCEHCDQTFEVNWKLEMHLKTHQESQKFGCDKCGKVFLLKWRLEQHNKTHVLSNIKLCHYFNNMKHCPYENIGCMFKHETASWCKYQDACTNNLCQFRHNQRENMESEKFECQKCGFIFENNNDLKMHKEKEHNERHAMNEHDDGDDQSVELFPCDSCDKIFEEIEDLIEHYGETAHNL